jgi:nitroreductase
MNMEFFDVVGQRCSIRNFTGEVVDDEKIRQILEAVQRAPSAGNLQAYEIYVVAEESLRSDLMRAAWGQEFIRQAPIALVFCTNSERNEQRYRERGVQLYSVQDATIACTYAMLAATALGLASTWVGAFDVQSVHQIIGAPELQTPVAILPIGYPAEKPERRERRRLDETVHWVGGR